MPPPTFDNDVCDIVTVQQDSEFLAFLDTRQGGISLRPITYGERSNPVLKSEAGDFVKWMRMAHPELLVSLPENTDRLILHSADIWLPLAFIASDIALPIYLNVVSGYLYDKMKGLLVRETLRVHLSVEYHDKKHGITKRFNFAGDAETLKATIKKIDLNQLFDEERPE